MTRIPKDKYIVLFDGFCNLCNSSIQFVIKNDKEDKFVFATLQGETGQELVKRFQIDTEKTDSVVLYTPENGMDYKSTAALKIAGHLGFPHTLWCVFFIVPPFLRNWVYDLIAKNRYKWFGKRTECMVPTPELQKKFLD